MYRPYLFCVVAMVGLGVAGCGSSETPTGGIGHISGHVIVSGPLHGASVSIDQLDPKTGGVRTHVADTTTDQDGWFEADIGLANGFLRATASGGTFVDLATGATIQLDPADKLNSLVRVELNEMRDDVLVSPVGHLVDARAAWKLAELGDVTKAVSAATEHLHRHFGNVDWSRVQLVSLDQPATSPTEPVRAALVQAALSVLAKDIATAAESSPQDVNVYTLTKQLAADIGNDAFMGLSVFDGNDGNNQTPAMGLQLGACKPVPACDVLDGCTVGCGRTLCDLYAGTPRALLAGAMTKVIQDNDPENPAALNKTKLNLSDTLAIARSINDNLDDDLFGDACIEQLDRLPPSIKFLPPTPAEGGYAGGTLTVKVSAIDDTDASPRITILGYPDADGDPTNSVAIAAIDTTGMPDGGADVQVAAVDMAGNTATVSRSMVIDNTLPELSLDAAGFLVDGSTWWTTNATPTLRGAVADAAPVSVKAVVNGVDVAGSVNGTAWTVILPAGALDTAGTPVTIVATDAAGNHRDIIQRIRPDVTAPELSFQASNVNDEAGDQITFALDDSPIHTHAGTPIDLSTSNGCPLVTKYSYLLGPSSPPFVTEQPARNPVSYQLVAADSGVGIVAGSTQYRVKRRELNGGSTVVLDWTSAGAGTSLGGGAQRFSIAMQSDLVMDLATTEATYDVEFRSTDRLSRTSTTARCFELQLRAPPLHFTSGGRAVSQPFALDSTSLVQGAIYNKLAARLLNNDATGASLIDQFVANGTTETVYLTVTVTKPSSVAVSQQFVINNRTTTTDLSPAVNCDYDTGNPAACDQPQQFPSAEYVSPIIPTTATTLSFPARLYELNASGVPTTSIPCIAPCPASGSVFKFAVPPRSSTGPARKFVVMTMIGQVSSLWPSDTNRPSAPSFSDLVSGGIDYTGKNEFSSTGCSPGHTILLAGKLHCNQRTTRRQYRALNYAKLDFLSDTGTDYATAPTVQHTPRIATPTVSRHAMWDWFTNETALP